MYERGDYNSSFALHAVALKNDKKIKKMENNKQWPQRCRAALNILVVS